MTPGPPPFQRFLDTHREAVWRLLVSSVGRADAEDCFQETFIAALRAYPRLRPDSNLRAWVLTIAHHKALDVHRGHACGALPVAEIAAVADGAGARSEQGRARAHAHGIGPGPLPPEKLTDALAERDEMLWDAVHELPACQRAAILLRYVADLPHRDIAGAIGCSEEAARRSLHEGLRKLRKVIA